FPHKIKALSCGQRVGRKRPQICVLRPSPEEAPVSFHLDCADWRRRQAAWHQLQPIYQRLEKGRSRAGPQGTGRHRSQRSGGIWRFGRNGQAGARGVKKQPALSSQHSAKETFPFATDLLRCAQINLNLAANEREYCKSDGSKPGSLSRSTRIMNC